MTPVINPWVFYLLGLVDPLKYIALTATIFIGCGLFIHCICEGEKAPKKLYVIAGLLLALAFFVPNSKTVTKMVLAQNVTYERVEAVTDTVETVYNDIMDLFEED